MNHDKPESAATNCTTVVHGHRRVLPGGSPPRLHAHPEWTQIYVYGMQMNTDATVTDDEYSVAVCLDNPQGLMARRNISMRVGTALFAPT